nr:MoaD/ThiS family protein [Candidatus Sigynarchaeota archaeon]
MPLNLFITLYAEARDIAGKGRLSIITDDVPPDLQAFFNLLNEETGGKLVGTVLTRNNDGMFELGTGYRLMQNRKIIDTSHLIEIKPGDELGILPPFSGG